jgi:hypothetical protein
MLGGMPHTSHVLTVNLIKSYTLTLLSKPCTYSLLFLNASYKANKRRGKKKRKEKDIEKDRKI